MQNLAEKKIPLLNITDEGGDQLFDLATLWNDDMELIDYIPRNEETLKDPEMLVSIGMCQKLLNQAYEDTFRHFLENPKKTYLFKSI